jgi:hypothetical protein
VAWFDHPFFLFFENDVAFSSHLYMPMVTSAKGKKRKEKASNRIARGA